MFCLHFALPSGRLTQQFVYFKFSPSARGHYRMVDDSKILPGDYGIVNSKQSKAKEAEVFRPTLLCRKRT